DPRRDDYGAAGQRQGEYRGRQGHSERSRFTSALRLMKCVMDRTVTSTRPFATTKTRTSVTQDHEAKFTSSYPARDYVCTSVSCLFGPLTARVRQFLSGLRNGGARNAW